MFWGFKQKKMKISDLREIEGMASTQHLSTYCGRLHAWRALPNPLPTEMTKTTRSRLLLFQNYCSNGKRLNSRTPILTIRSWN